MALNADHGRKMIDVTDADYPKDKNGIILRPFDVVKIYHFTDRRGKKRYMYKYIEGIEIAGGCIRMRLNHLSGNQNEHFTIAMDGKTLEDYEIVQGYYGGMPFEDRTTG